MSDDIQHYRDIIAIKKKRLRELEKQKAISGTYTDPRISSEIEDLKKEIKQLQSQIEALLPVGTFGLSVRNSGRPEHLRLFNCEREKEIFLSMLDRNDNKKLFIITSGQKTGKTRLLNEFKNICTSRGITVGRISFKGVSPDKRTTLDFILELTRSTYRANLFPEFASEETHNAFLRDISVYSGANPIVFLIDDFEYIQKDTPEPDAPFPIWFIDEFLQATILNNDKFQSFIVLVIAGTQSPIYYRDYEEYKKRTISISLSSWDEDAIKMYLEYTHIPSRLIKKWTKIFKELVDNQLVTTHELIELIQKLSGRPL